MSALDAVLAAAFFAGALLLVAETRVARRSPLSQRLAPYAPPTTAGRTSPEGRAVPAASLAPAAEAFGRRLGHLTGVRTDLPTRLAHAGRAESPGEFRMTQFLRTLGTFTVTGIALAVLRPGPLVALIGLVGLPLLVALAHEQALEAGARRRRETIELELPVVAEQLGILLGAGLSLTAAADRISRRGNGLVAEDLARVVRRSRHGVSEIRGLREWADTTDAEGVERLVSVLCLHRDAADLGALITTESRAIRAATHRRLLEQLERRAQMVWVPVTVATLVPGLILIGVPFVDAMSRVAG